MSLVLAFKEGKNLKRLIYIVEKKLSRYLQTVFHICKTTKLQYITTSNDSYLWVLTTNFFLQMLRFNKLYDDNNCYK